MSMCVTSHTATLPTAPTPDVAPTTTGGGEVPAPVPGDLASAIAGLTAAVEQLAAVVQSLQGAGALGSPAGPTTNVVSGGASGAPLADANVPATPVPAATAPVAPVAPAAPAAPAGNPGKQKLQLPVKNATVTSHFGEVSAIRNSIPHTGTDYAVPAGTSVDAAAGGVVKQVSSDSIGGNWIIVDHGDGLQTYYGHLSAQDVKVGDVVTQGQHIGKVGSTGLATGPHLHFGLFRGDDRTKNLEDPQAFMARGGEV
ncbi:MAG: peptidase [Thermoleophilia bacterium]|nr:peptidase [Thermoleophilia bacterium]